MPSFGVSTKYPKNSSSFNIFSTSAIIFIRCGNRHHMKTHIKFKGNINNTSIIVFLMDLSYFLMAFSPRPSLLLRGPSYPKNTKTSDVIVMVGLFNWIQPSFKFWLDARRRVSGIHTPWNHGFSMPLAMGSWFNKNSQRSYLLGRTSSEVLVMLVIVLPSLPFFWCLLLLFLRFRATFPCYQHSTLAS